MNKSNPCTEYANLFFILGKATWEHPPCVIHTYPKMKKRFSNPIFKNTLFLTLGVVLWFLRQKMPQKWLEKAQIGPGASHVLARQNQLQNGRGKNVFFTWNRPVVILVFIAICNLVDSGWLPSLLVDDAKVSPPTRKSRSTEVKQQINRFNLGRFILRHYVYVCVL